MPFDFLVCGELLRTSLADTVERSNASLVRTTPNRVLSWFVTDIGEMPEVL